MDWLRFGSPIADAKRGAVAIFSPIVSEATSGFVGFALSADDKNVDNWWSEASKFISVALAASFPRASVRGYRWPDQ